MINIWFQILPMFETNLASQYFTTIDLASGFHQIEIYPEDIQKTTSSVGNGHYEFLRMSFGL